MAKSLRLVIAVLVTCVVAAAGLAVTYAVTAPRIEAEKIKAEQRSLEAVMPDATSFEAVDDAALLDAANDAADPVEVSAVYRAMDGESAVGWALKVASRGYGGPMQLVIGLDSSGSVTGVSILTMNETPGLGTKVQTEKWFIAQVTDLPAGFTDADVRTGMDAISGATRSSNGVRNGVAAAGRVFSDVLDTEGGEDR